MDPHERQIPRTHRVKYYKTDQVGSIKYNEKNRKIIQKDLKYENTCYVKYETGK